MSKSKFIGEAGEHFVAYKLAQKQYYVGLTLGNMPDVDLLLSSHSGLKTISIQVKTSGWAYRRNRYGSEGYEWDVNTSVIGRHSTTFWYLFVDLKGEQSEPDVYVVPSKWVADFVKPSFSRKLFFLPKGAADITRNRWDILERIFQEDEEILKWATTWDHENLVRWGPKSEQSN
ncbi:hypothetical protein [Christiangramia sp. SM2212]|uniref:PD(D/E)XK endonuclease domain-containing protein n=1 Tax=Christiangramia sediminicola TaxID=3073267 RepID=A0ABU1EU22_9FLAO|nr:hypothetical protein [Christiangramia sp. SM2212]MDR5591900.1 hypothetical protein [Christiangramia sp. SM2212]